MSRPAASPRVALHRIWPRVAALLATVSLTFGQTAAAQVAPTGVSSPVAFGDLAAGPYKRLVIRGAMVIPGHGGPPAGPYDIVIEGNMITQMTAFTSSRWMHSAGVRNSCVPSRRRRSRTGRSPAFTSRRRPPRS